MADRIRVGNMEMVSLTDGHGSGKATGVFAGHFPGAGFGKLVRRQGRRYW